MILRALPMSRVRLWLLSSETQDAALLLARHGLFDPVAEESDALPEKLGQEYRDTYAEAAARMQKILSLCGEETPDIPPHAMAPALEELQAVNAALKQVWLECSRCWEEAARSEEASRQLQSLAENFVRLQTLDIDLSLLGRQDTLLDFRLGSLPEANQARLREALALAGYLLRVFGRAQGLLYAVAAGTRSEAAGVSRLLAQAGWHDLHLPPELQTHPEAARAWLDEEARQLQNTAAGQLQAKQATLQRYRVLISEAQRALTLAQPLAEAAAKGVRGRGHLAAFSGWAPRRELPTLRAALEQRFSGRYLLHARDPKLSEYGQVPSLLVYPAWLRSFAPLVGNFGVPRYGEFDPTLLFAFSYVLLFGAMFGDVGHGAVLLGLAVLLRGRLVFLRGVGVAVGLASIGFGWLYGSVFGNESLIQAVWTSPMHDPAATLMVAVWLGVGFVATTQLINAYNRFAAGRILDAMLQGNALAGLVFYVALVRGMYAWLALDRFSVASAVFAAMGLGSLILGAWVNTRGAFAERVLVSVIESFETIISLFANTLSYLRVAAFSLNHVALSLAVFAVAGGLDRWGHGLTLLLGNVVIIVLEGGIVAIQALRLMYYENFSRFFSGDGHVFSPLRLAVPGVEERVN
jgi:V/A-type H+-transporting ATPase subunit I